MSPFPIASAVVDGSEAPLIPQSDQEHAQGVRKTTPSFHLLIPASESNSNLCKTILSSFILGYPSPTLINYGKVFDDSKLFKGSHTGKIRGVLDFLNDEKNVKDEDMVLIVDGYDVWFQLPPRLMIERYYMAIDEANERLRRRYGTVVHEKPGTGETENVPKYTQKVLFGADKLCWPNSAEDPACAAIPYSTLPKNVYGPETDIQPEGFLNRPRYLNSGTIIGPVAEVRAVYEIAVKKVEGQGRGMLGDQFVFAEVFGEQEYQREVQRKSSQGTGGRWLEWLSDALGTSDSPLSANITIHNMTVNPGQNYEYAIGLDYESQLFQTMTHSQGDVQYVIYNDTNLLSHIQEDQPSLWSRPFSLPTDIQRADPPYSYASRGNYSQHPTDVNLLPFSAKLDDIVDEPSWYEVALATNIKSSAVPSLLHFNGDKSLLKSWWTSMWYSSNSRALLRRYIRSATGPNAAYAAIRGGLDAWDTRGGRGGVWTDHKTWMRWAKVCKKTEDDVFVDGKGVWGREEGSRKTVNSFGQVIYEDESEDE